MVLQKGTKMFLRFKYIFPITKVWGQWWRKDVDKRKSVWSEAK